MAIIPVSSIQSIKNINPVEGALSKIGGPPVEEKLDFKNALLGIIENAESTEAVTREDAYKLSIGQVDDLHTIMINSAKADIALQMMVQLRNKVLDAYSELMRINL